MDVYSLLTRMFIIIVEAVTRMMDEGHTVDVIYLDFANAFDSVNHGFLLAKMKSFGLSDVVVRWIEAYLSGWVSRVQRGGEHSGAIPMHSGVPQGSVIGPLLFLLFVNDLQDVLERMTLLFADDGDPEVTEYEPLQFSYCCMGLAEELGPADQSY